MKKREISVFGGGCFWCTEAIYRELRGVFSVIPGYAGGTLENPTYDQVCSGKTGHAEVIKIEFNPEEISYYDLLTVFFSTHDPTTLNRQGNDIGTQYRSIIFYENKIQKSEAEAFIEQLNQNENSSKIVTEVRPSKIFYPAEDYHHNYYERNSWQPYCQVVIHPKLEKLRERFHALLKQPRERL